MLLAVIEKINHFTFDRETNDLVCFNLNQQIML